MNKLFDRISIDPKICHGRACVRGTRILVSLLVEFLANGDTVDDLLKAYPELTRDDVFACLAFAAEMTRERVIPIGVSA